MSLSRDAELLRPPLNSAQANSAQVNRAQDDDLGIGRIQAERARARFLNKDGSFNSKRLGLTWLESLSPFYWMLSISWSAFFGIITAAFLVVNIFFAVLYTLCGPEALQMTTSSPIENPFWRGFFFSVETLSTIGYGHIAPVNIAAHIVSSIQAFIGLLGVALVTGLVYARFSKPFTKVLWSHNALIAPFQEGHGLMFRIANGLRNDIIEVSAQVSIAMFEMVGGKRTRRFHQLDLERSSIAFFTLSWTLVHPITPKSPLWELTEQDLLEREAEILVVLHGIDDTLYERVHSRSSYKAEEIIWHAKFDDVYTPGPDIAIDVRKLHQYTRLEPSTSYGE
jgi:inward rectifier potassium channel